jgi:hypothetical protein
MGDDINLDGLDLEDLAELAAELGGDLWSGHLGPLEDDERDGAFEVDVDMLARYVTCCMRGKGHNYKIDVYRGKNNRPYINILATRKCKPNEASITGEVSDIIASVRYTPSYKGLIIAEEMPQSQYEKIIETEKKIMAQHRPALRRLAAAMNVLPLFAKIVLAAGEPKRCRSPFPEGAVYLRKPTKESYYLTAEAELAEPGTGE